MTFDSPMLLLKALQRLATKWRKAAKDYADYGQPFHPRADAFKACANELEAVIAAIPSPQTWQPKKEKGMDRHLLQRASRMFNSVADLRTEEDQRINEWFKAKLAESIRCARCGQSQDSDLHYIGTVDSHEFEPLPDAVVASPRGGPAK